MSYFNLDDFTQKKGLTMRSRYSFKKMLEFCSRAELKRILKDKIELSEEGLGYTKAERCLAYAELNRRRIQ